VSALINVDGQARPALDARYIRVSAVMGREDERFLSPDLQRAAIERGRAAAGPSVLVAEEVDLDVSGGSMDRPGLSRLLELARLGQITRLWVLDLSRWARTTTEGLAELERIEAHGCRVMSTAEPVELGTPEGYFSATMMLAVHKMKRDQIARSWRQVIAHRAARGLWHGQAPLGYRRAEGGGIEPDPVLGPAMVTVFRRYAAGEVLARIAADFNRARGKPSHAHTEVRRALGHELYVGKVRLGTQVFDGVHTPLVTQALWTKVQARLQVDARTPGRRLALGYPLTGLVFCGLCGGPMNHHARRWVRLECREQHRKNCPGSGQPSAERVLAEVLAQLQVRYARIRYDQATAAVVAAPSRTEQRRLAKELKDTRTARGRLAVDLARQLVDEGAFRLADEELAALEASLTLTMAEGRDVKPTTRARTVEGVGTALVSRWPKMAAHEQNRALRMLLTSVTLHRGDSPSSHMADRLTVHWRDEQPENHASVRLST
jgi:site-specific DNA recombinase